jgi:phosphoglycolate phosphatase-like HAD superfamily hydrolase
MTDRLPSWRPGETRERLIAYLDDLKSVPVDERVACFDNDGTLWTERPSYIQLDFFVGILTRQVESDPTLRERPEFAALLSHDAAAMDDIGLERLLGSLTSLLDGLTPEQFTAVVLDFKNSYKHRTLGTGLEGLVFQPMLELLDELRALEFTVGVVTGGGTEFVRVISELLYGIPSELVVGSLIGYDFIRDDQGQPSLVRKSSAHGKLNDKEAKVEHIQMHIGRRPILAAGNTAGDQAMLEYALAGPQPGLAILIDHDDADREFSYAGSAETTAEGEPIRDVADRLGWLKVSVANDWARVFP